MKRLWFALVLLAVLCAASLANSRYAQSLSDSLTSQLAQAHAFAQQDQWEDASRLTLQAHEEWQSHHFYLHTFMRHADTDQILRTFRSVLEYLEIRELDQYTAANADLVTQIQLLAEMEQASVVNIL